MILILLFYRVLGQGARNTDNFNEETNASLSKFTSEVVDYWVSKGFDSDEIVALGSRKSIEFLITIARRCPNLDNKIFDLHIRAFVHSLTKVAVQRAPMLERIHEIKLQQVIRLADALSSMD